MKYDYSTVNMENIKILRDYLDGLPADYSDFDMETFADDEVRAVKATPKTGCGTAACMVGHGPAAGVAMIDSEWHEHGVGWFNYSERVFIGGTGCSSLWAFAFGGDWPSDLRQAVARLDLILSKSVPAEWEFGDRFPETESLALPAPSVMDILMMTDDEVDLPEKPEIAFRMGVQS